MLGSKRYAGNRTRDDVYTFAHGAVEAGHPQAAAAPVICFEWLQRPENVLAGYLRWPDYRSTEHPTALKIFRHKTGAVVWHPLEETQDGNRIIFYQDAEAVLAALPRLSVPVILHPSTNGGPAKPYSEHAMARAGSHPAGEAAGRPRDLHARFLPAWRDD